MPIALCHREQLVRVYVVLAFVSVLWILCEKLER